MAQTNLSLWIGGAAGEGAASTGEIFLKACARSGLHAYGYNSYPSVIRGGHTLFQAMVGPEKVWSQADSCDVLVALNQDSIEREAKDASSCVLYDPDRHRLDAAILKPGAKLLGFPSKKLVEEPLLWNTATLGALMWLAGLDFPVLEELLRDRFSAKGPRLQEANLRAARAGFEYAVGNLPEPLFPLPRQPGKKLLMTGNQAIALGAMAAGCRFFSAYPMTPASSILHWLALRATRHGLVVKQAEDEIAAVNMAIGAAHAGVRSMCATSGGGFALMTEALGEAAMTETPLVVVQAQRAGPSTGLPTKTEQGDLFQVLGASQGDYPKAVLAPVTVEDAFKTTAEAFNLAEKYQVPVVVLSDLLLSERFETLDGLDMDVPIERGLWVDPQPEGGAGEYLRYRETDTGVSPRAVPGQEGLSFTAATDEHDERGQLLSDVAYDPFKRIRMMDKRMRKLDYVARDMKPTLLEGPRDAALTLVGWGSTYNLMRFVMEKFNSGGMARVNILPIRNLWPFPFEAVAEVLYQARRVLAIESNHSAQLCRLIRMETGFYIRHRWLKYDGEPFYPGSTFQKVYEVLRAN